jgi:pyruvate/2-oxoglutarate dehydrogenase complex dihydrolipoamide acyltransferase (E2) component
MILRRNSGALTNALIVAVCGLVGSSACVAYARPQEPEPVARTISIPDGTPIHLYLMDDLSSKKAKNGDSIRFKVREAVQVSGDEVISVGAPVIGHVGTVGHSSFAGHSGKLGLLIDYVVAVNGARISLRGVATVKGGSNGAVTAAATAYWGPPALLIRGWEADIRKGTMLNAYVNGDQTVALGSSNGANHPIQNVASGKIDTVGVVETSQAPPVQRSVPASERTAEASNAENSTSQPSIQGTIGVSCDGDPLVRHNGLTVSQVVAGGPADQIGIKPGDVILAVDDHYLYTIDELNNAIVPRKPGTEIRIRYRRYKMTYEAPLIVGSREAKEAQR